MDTVQITKPDADSMCLMGYTANEWLQYYQNIWTRNLIARTIDIKSDEAQKAKNKNEEVQLNDGRIGTVAERLEERKQLVIDALKILGSIEVLMAMSAEELSACWSEKALAVADDMITPPPVEAAPESPATEPVAEIPAEPTPVEAAPSEPAQ